MAPLRFRLPAGFFRHRELVQACRVELEPVRPVEDVPHQGRAGSLAYRVDDRPELYQATEIHLSMTSCSRTRKRVARGGSYPKTRMMSRRSNSSGSSANAASISSLTCPRRVSFGGSG